MNSFINIQFITGDRKGFDISRKRIVDDMNYPLELVSTTQRIKWIEERYALEEVIYMGDGIFDHYVMKKVGYGIAPANSDPNAKKYADFVTERSGGNRAVAEACLHILDKFFEPYNPELIPSSAKKMLSNWTV